MDADYVADKCKDESQAVIFSQEERQRLWRECPDLPRWAWVFKQDDAALKKFQDELKEMAQLDGCGVEYVTLTGPDLLPDRHCGNRAKFSFGCNERIVCDLRRSCKIVSHGVLKQLKGFAPWKKVGTVGRVRDRTTEVRAREEPELPFETAGNRDLVRRGKVTGIIFNEERMLTG